jgi:hypothetical protein
MSHSRRRQATAPRSRRIGPFKRLALGGGLVAAVMSVSLAAAGSASATTPTITTSIQIVGSPVPAGVVDIPGEGTITVTGVTTPLAYSPKPVTFPTVIPSTPHHAQHCDVLDEIDQECIPGVPASWTLGRMPDFDFEL